MTLARSVAREFMTNSVIKPGYMVKNAFIDMLG